MTATAHASSSAAPAFKLLDGAERIAIVLLFGWFVHRLAPSALMDGAWHHWVLLVSESAVVLFVLFRRGTDAISRKPTEWSLAFGATLGPLMVQPHGGQALAPILLCGVLMFAGLVVQCYAKLTLRRSFGIVPANRGVKLEGPYRVVRHPMYAGYLLTHVGFLLSYPTVWNAAIYAVSLALQVARLLAEERLLNEDPAYRALTAKVRYRLFPGVF